MLLNSIFFPNRESHSERIRRTSSLESLANVIYDVNSLVKEKEIKIHGQTIGLDFFLGDG